MPRPAAALLLLTLVACAAPTSSAPTRPQRERSVSTHKPELPAAPAAPTVRSFHDFRPSLHGFAFRNDFDGSPLPINLGAAEKALRLPNHYGLCGGMSFSAADFYLAGRTLTTDTTPPSRGTPLYTYLYTRQSASLAPAGSGALRFMEWMRLPDAGPDSTSERTRAEIPAIRAAVARGEAVHLGLVLVAAAQNPQPWNNHQVLVYNASTGPAEYPLELHIYDPNYPKRDDAIIRIEDDRGTLRCTRLVPGRRPTNIRGIFRMAYTPAIPPASLSPAP